MSARVGGARAAARRAGARSTPALAPRALALEVDRRLRQATDRRRQRATAGYFPSALESLGVRTPVLRALARECTRRLVAAPPAALLAFAHAVLRQGTLEGRQVAYLTLHARPDVLTRASAKTIETLGRGMDNWASVDTFASYVAGPAWRDRRVRDADLARWSRSRDRWWRRAALVSTVALNTQARGGRGDARRTLALCGALVADADDMVVKALSWALRELAKRDPAAVRAFLGRHRGALHARVTREVTNKLTTGRKARPRQT